MINSGPVCRIDPPHLHSLSPSLSVSLSLFLSLSLSPSTNTKLYTAINSCLSLHPSSVLPARIDADYCWWSVLSPLKRAHSRTQRHKHDILKKGTQFIINSKVLMRLHVSALRCDIKTLENGNAFKRLKVLKNKSKEWKNVALEFKETYLPQYKTPKSIKTDIKTTPLAIWIHLNQESVGSKSNSWDKQLRKSGSTQAESLFTLP